MTLNEAEAGRHARVLPGNTIDPPVEPEDRLSPLVALVAGACGIAVGELLATSRGSRRAVLARQVAMYLAVVDLELSQHAVGAFFRRRHSTVGHNVRRIEDRRDDPVFDAWLTELEAEAATFGRSAC